MTQPRVLPPQRDHRARAAYWGHECVASIRAIDDGTSTAPQLDADHAYRTARVAAGHALKARADLREPRPY